MNDEDIERWVRDVVQGDDVPGATARLARSGERGVRAVLEARSRPWPEERHRNDVDSDLTGVLAAIAAVDPEPVAAALDESGHASALVWALGCSGHSEAVAPLVRALAHREPWVRWSAAVGLGRTCPPAALEPLVARLRDRSSNVRRAVREALAGYDDDRARAALGELKAK